MAGEPQGHEFTISTEYESVNFAPLGAEFTIATEYHPVNFAPLGAEFTVVAPTIPPPGTPPVLDAEGGQISVSDGSQALLNWEAASGTVLNYAMVRVPGDLPVPAGSDWDTVTEETGAVILTETILDTATTYTDTLPEDAKGESWTYYLFARGLGGYGLSDAILIETIPAAPVSFIVTDPDDGTLVLVWTAITASNVDGVNIYRSKWGWNNDESVKLNVALVTGNTFVDGAGNANRVSAGTAEYPVDGEHWAYVYRIEAQDTTTSWQTGTSNAVAGGVEVTVATKIAISVLYSQVIGAYDLGGPPSLSGDESQIIMSLSDGGVWSADTDDGSLTTAWGTNPRNPSTTYAQAQAMPILTEGSTADFILLIGISTGTDSMWAINVSDGTLQAQNTIERGWIGPGLDWGGGAWGACYIHQKVTTAQNGYSGLHDYDSLPGSTLSGTSSPGGVQPFWVQAASAAMVYDTVSSHWMYCTTFGVTSTKFGRGDCDYYAGKQPYFYTLGAGAGWYAQLPGTPTMSVYFAMDSSKNFIIGASDGKVYARAFADGSAVWDTSTNLTGSFDNLRGPAIDSSGNIYIANSAGRVYKLNSSGVKQWETSDLGTMWGVPIVGDGDDIYTSTGSTVLAINKSTGDTSWALDLEGSDLSGLGRLMDSSGYLYVFENTTGKLHKLDVGCTGMDTGWPCLMQTSQRAAKLT